MNNDPAVPAGPGGDQIKDSSLNSNHFSNDYGLISGDLVDAYIGKGLHMVEKPIQRNGALSQPSSVTLSAWVNVIGVLPGKGGVEVVNISNVWGLRLADNNTGRDGFYWHQLAGFNWNGINITPPAPLPDPQSICVGTGWHHFVATFDNIGKTQKLYVDGILKASGTFPDSVVYEWSHCTAIGKHCDNDLYDYNGTIDETRISDIPRSEEWIQTEYNNMSSPSTFYSVW